MLRNVAFKDMWGERNTVVVVGIALLVALVMVGLLAPPAHAFSTFTVNRTGDQPDANTANSACDIAPSTTGAQCTLRAAIQQANANNNPSQVDRINFHISGSGVKTISPNSAFPFTSEPVIINGYSQPGSSVNTLAKGTNAKLLIQINGANSGAIGALGGITIASNNTVVKGLVINRFDQTAGIQIEAPLSASVVKNVKIQGNFIGTDPSGTIARANQVGIFLFATSNSTVGGTSRADRNLVSGNTLAGVFIEGAGNSGFGNSDNNTVRGNLIGTQKNAIKSLGNGTTGVAIFEDTPNAATGNSILSNSIFANGDLGIDLGDDGPTPNDPGDTDSGPNDLQNKPSLGSAKTGGGTTTIKGTLNSNSNRTYTIQFFSNPRGNEGRTFVGSKKVSTDGSGHASFTFSTTNAVAVGKNVTATATRLKSGNPTDTSEFSAPKTVTAK